MSETKLLYRAIRELAYIQETGHECISKKRPDLVITSEGAAIVMEGMALLRVKDLAADELPVTAPDPRIAAAEEMAKALDAFVEAWDKSHQLEKTDIARRMALVSLAAWNALK